MLERCRRFANLNRPNIIRRTYTKPVDPKSGPSDSTRPVSIGPLGLTMVKNPMPIEAQYLLMHKQRLNQQQHQPSTSFQNSVPSTSFQYSPPSTSEAVPKITELKTQKIPRTTYFGTRPGLTTSPSILTCMVCPIKGCSIVSTTQQDLANHIAEFHQGKRSQPDDSTTTKENATVKKIKSEL